MARTLRLEQPGGVWHVTSRGNNQGDIFFDDADRLMFLEFLSEAVLRFRWLVHEYTLMTNHFHLVIETPETTLSRGMKWVKQKYAQRINKKYKRSGHLFQGRFGSQLVEKETYMLNVMRYTVLNPVRAGIVARPENYRWSSCRAKMGLEAAPEWLTMSTLEMFGADRESQRAAYARFVNGGGAERSPFEDVIGQIFVGSKEWVESMQKKIDSKPRSTEHPAAQRFAGRPDVNKVIKTVAEVFNAKPEEIRNSHGGAERQLVAWLCCYETNERYAKVAAALRLRSTSRVSVLVEECRATVQNEPLIGVALDRCLDLLRGTLQVVGVTHQQHYPSASLHA